jgi:hypothetical protein
MPEELNADQQLVVDFLHWLAYHEKLTLCTYMEGESGQEYVPVMFGNIRLAKGFLEQRQDFVAHFEPIGPVVKSQ